MKSLFLLASLSVMAANQTWKVTSVTGGMVWIDERLASFIGKHVTQTNSKMIVAQCSSDTSLTDKDQQSMIFEENNKICGAEVDPTTLLHLGSCSDQQSMVPYFVKLKNGNAAIFGNDAIVCLKK